jgi:hypothetical protein
VKLKTGDAIRVTWLDACGGGGGWKAPLTDGVTVTNVGVFVAMNKNGLCLASGVDPKDKELVLEPSFIPAAMIRKIRKLR